MIKLSNRTSIILILNLFLGVLWLLSAVLSNWLDKWWWYWFYSSGFLYYSRRTKFHIDPW